jgi:hypothetical protein
LAYVLSGPIGMWWRRRTGGELEAARDHSVESRPAATEGAGEEPEGTRWTHE